MSDLISRQAAIDAIQGYFDGMLETDTWSPCDVYGLIEILPSAAAQPVRHGHWIICENQNQDDVNNGNYLYVCSNCNHSDIHAKTVEVPFCWFCGARMDGEIG